MFGTSKKRLEVKCFVDGATNKEIDDEKVFDRMEYVRHATWDNVHQEGYWFLVIIFSFGTRLLVLWLIRG